MATTPVNQPLIRVGDQLALVLDGAILERMGITADTLVRVTEADGALTVTPLNRQGREAMFTAALATMSTRYETTLRRLAE